MERTIVLVDDHSLFRNGLRGLLEHCAGCRVVGEAASGEEFLAMLPELEADIVFMDFAMPGIDGAQATERALARRPELRIITLSMFGEESYYTRMVQAGARGFLLKDSDIGDVVEAIDTVMAGGSYFSPQLARGASAYARGCPRRGAFGPRTRNPGGRMPRPVEPGDRRRTVHLETYGRQAPRQHPRKDRL